MVQSNILTWNCKDYYQHYEDLYLLLSTYNPQVLCLQEKHLKTDHLPQHSTYTIMTTYPTSNVHAHGGALIAVKESISFQQIIIHEDLQVIAIKLNFNTPVTICCFYPPPQQPIEQQTFRQILRQLPAPVILVGDFNAHNPLWGGR